jgi:hypothetical protein
VSTRAVAPTVAAPVAALTPLQRPILQRTCDCGEHTGGGECEDCKKKKKMPLQRQANGASAPASAPPIVHEVLSSPGQPLDPDTREFFESGFGHDFSGVQVHTDWQAAESAKAVSASAYTVGENVVFGAGRYSPATHNGRRLLAHELTHVVQQKQDSTYSPQYRLEIGPPQDRFEREADQMADRIGEMDASQGQGPNLPGPNLQTPNVFPTPFAPRVQRAEASGSSAGSTGTAPGPSQATASLLVEDDAKNVQPGQMRKDAFLDKLQASVCSTADEVLSSVGRSAQGCPYIERWIGHLRSKSSRFVERGIRKYAPDSAGVTKAEDYIPFVTVRVRRGVTRWAKTGEITEVPEELQGQLSAANALGAAEKLISRIGGALGGVASAVAGGVNKAVSAIGSVFAKERDGGLRDAGDPQAIQARLRSGNPLDAGIRSRMETAFGNDFSDVRVHKDSAAAELSTRLNARAFTIGSNVAFASGEYQPGTVIGDALIAHELAHVMQQRDASSRSAHKKNNAAEYNALEEDADTSAMGAVISLWNDSKAGLTAIDKRSLPSLRSGLRLQRCGAKQAQTPVASPAVKPAGATPTAEGTTAEGTTAGPTAVPDASAAAQIPCGGSSKASTYTPTAQGLDPQADLGTLFGVTSKMPSTTTFDACKVGESWRFYLKDLVVRIASAVQPENFRTNVNAAADPVVTRESYPGIIRDLKPTAEGDDTHHCGGAAFPEHVTHYSHRRHFWKHQLTVEHEAFHRNDWNNMYRSELIQAESEVWKFSLPAASASTPQAAVTQATQTLRSHFTDAYNRTCQKYAPLQETRAYTAGAPDYQNLVDAIQTRATSEGWDRPAQQPQQQPGQQQHQPAQVQHQPPGQQQQQPPPQPPPTH